MSLPSTTPVTPEKFMRYTWGYGPPLILHAAVEHKVFDVLEPAPLTIAETARATGASERGLASIMNALVGLEFLTKDSAGRYGLAEDSRMFLVSTKPSFMGGILKHMAAELIPRWLALADVVKTGKPDYRVNEQKDGSEFFSSLVVDLFPFNYQAAIAGAVALGVESVTKPVRVLDLAAGSGVWSIAIAQKSPLVTITAVDWPGVLDVTRQFAARFGLSERLTCVAGDIATADFGTGYDVATLGHILHSEGVERSRALLKKTFDALASGGRIMIAEFLVDAERSRAVMGLLFDVNMLVHTEKGGTFSFEEISGWLTDAGFRNVRTVDTPGPSPLILAEKP